MSEALEEAALASPAVTALTQLCPGMSEGDGRRTPNDGFGSEALVTAPPLLLPLPLPLPLLTAEPEPEPEIAEAEAEAEAAEDGLGTLGGALVVVGCGGKSAESLRL